MIWTLSLGEQVVETSKKPEIGWDPVLSHYIRSTSTGETVVRLPVRFLRINNDIAIWATPLELFCEIAIEVRSRSPFPYTFYFGYEGVGDFAAKGRQEGKKCR
jgi:hypothetical protein